MAAATTELATRLLWTMAMLAVMALAYVAMWLAWRRARAADVKAFPALPISEQQSFESTLTVDGIYVSTTRAGHWLARVKAHRLGVRSRARVSVGMTGVVIERVGAESIFIERKSLKGVATGPGIAGKVVGGNGLAIISWQLGDEIVDTGVLANTAVDREGLVNEARKLLHG